MHVESWKTFLEKRSPPEWKDTKQKKKQERKAARKQTCMDELKKKTEEEYEVEARIMKEKTIKSHRRQGRKTHKALKNDEERIKKKQDKLADIKQLKL